MYRNSMRKQRDSRGSEVDVEDSRWREVGDEGEHVGDTSLPIVGAHVGRVEDDAGENPRVGSRGKSTHTRNSGRDAENTWQGNLGY